MGEDYFPVRVSMFVVIAKMDVKWCSFITFFVCVSLELQNVSGQIPGMTLRTNDGDMKCTRKYTTCRLDFDIKRGTKGEPGYPGRVGFPGEPGAKGDLGMPGRDGLQGETGAKGDPGDKGLIGPQGAVGEKGDRGYTGLPGLMGDRGDPGAMGPQGLLGPTGEKGTTGSEGPRGPLGLKGETGATGPVGPAGIKGSPGPVGPPGIPGRPGVCPCQQVPNGNDFPENNFVFGQKESPGDIPCKSAPSGTVSGNYYLGPMAAAIPVYCNMTTLETCIKINKTTQVINHSSNTAGFWLTEMNVYLKELYNETSVEQFTWLRERSEFVRQTLKYNCLDSVPYAKYNMSASVKLWASNDMVIGPYPTAQSPIFYSVLNGSDTCEPGSTEWKSTIIELQSSNAYRLPIVDVWIGDIRNANQKMSIESTELCFG